MESSCLIRRLGKLESEFDALQVLNATIIPFLPLVFFYGLGTSVVDAKTNACHIKEKEENPHEGGVRGEGEGQRLRQEEEEENNH